ncbi:HNH endonuclease [Brevibacterium aurantiacum]|uniref:HNH endonuclease n=1 Tax=Brevibacterium aurantiacum TaxID=273384 RepID=A0A2H1HV63_BREAU|nr:HNH endonuclease [Brevibacterium aurantiacum]SMX66801.1 HNH endonuclease [Brevibacterium aurantiacum]
MCEPHPDGLVVGPYELPASVDLIREIDRAVFVRTGTVPYSRRALFVRDRGRCCYCGEPGATMDHVMPKSRGGPAAWTNAVVACFDCNQRKADRTPEEAGMILLKPPFAPTWLDIYDPL